MEQCFTFKQLANPRIPIMVFILAVSMATIGQTHQNEPDIIPVEIKTSFCKKYPVTSEENWSVSGQAFQVSFKSGNDYCDAFFDENGKWVMTEKSILYEQLPKAIQDSLKTGEFSSWEKGSVFEVEMPGNSGIFKIFVYSREWNELELNFDKTGKRIL